MRLKRLVTLLYSSKLFIYIAFHFILFYFVESTLFMSLQSREFCSSGKFASISLFYDPKCSRRDEIHPRPLQKISKRYYQYCNVKSISIQKRNRFNNTVK